MNSTLETAPSPGSTASVWEDFVDIFFSPRQVFERRRDGRFVIALIVVTILLALLAFVVQTTLSTAFEADFRRGIESSAGAAQVDPAALEQMRSLSVTLGSLAALIMVPLGIAILGLFTWGVSRLFDAVLPLAAAVTIATYSAFPKVAQAVAAIVQGLVLDPQTTNAVQVGPARFLDPATASPVLLAALSRVELFTLWGALLIAIGVQVIGRLPRGQSYAVAGLVWLAGSLAAILPPLLFTMRG